MNDGMRRLVGGMALMLCLGALVLVGCGTESADPDRIVAEKLPPIVGHQLDAHRSLGEPVHAANLTVWPVFTSKPIDIGEFLTLQEAEARKVAVVRELGPVGGQTADAATPSNPTRQNPQGAQQEMEQGAQQEMEIVEEEEEPSRIRQELDMRINDQTLPGADTAEVGRVVIENQGDLPILVVAGTIIDGGNQDRQIGQDFVIAAGETVDVDAFCVEQGRWGGEVEVDGVNLTLSENVDANSVVGSRTFSAMRGGVIAPKVVRSAGQYGKNQGKVWQEVASSNRQLRTQNPTDTLMGALAEVDEKTKAARATYETKVGDAFAAWAKQENPPVGFAYAINGKPVTVRAFAHERILRSQLPLFLKTMAIEAHMVAGENEASARVGAKDVIAMVRGIQAARQAETIRTRASNQNVYFRNDVGFNARCELSGEALRKLTKQVGPDRVVITEDWTAK